VLEEEEECYRGTADTGPEMMSGTGHIVEGECRGDGAGGWECGHGPLVYLSFLPMASPTVIIFAIDRSLERHPHDR